MFSFRPASCLHFPSSCDDSLRHRLSLLAVRDWQQHSSLFVLLWMKLHSLCQLHCHSMKSLDPEGPLFLSISRGTASRRVGVEKNLRRRRLDFFAPINIGSWLYQVIAERIFRSFFPTRALMHTEDIATCIEIHDECTVIYYRSKLYENWRRIISPRAWNFIWAGTRPIWRITESLEFNFQWQGGWLMFCRPGRASLSIGWICVSCDRKIHPADDAHFVSRKESGSSAAHVPRNPNRLHWRPIGTGWSAKKSPHALPGRTTPAYRAPATITLKSYRNLPTRLASTDDDRLVLDDQ